MSTRDDPQTWKVSRYSALGYGVMIDDVLPSVGPDRCVYSDRCAACYKTRCTAGGSCSAEQHLFDAFIASMTTSYSYARSLLTDAEYDSVVRELAIVSLQMARLSARIAAESSLERSSGDDIAVNRYATALHRKQMRLMLKLIDEETAAYWMAI